MIKLIIFGGTREGRELSLWAADNGFSVTLCVATDYGESLLSPHDGLRIQKGRMDQDEMTAFFKENSPRLIIDATHPHAVLVSENIRAAAEISAIPLIRVIRPQTYLPCKDKYPDWARDSVFYVSSATEALPVLEKDEGVILLTTGSKEIPVFSSLPGFPDRVYARVLPESNAINVCEKAGLARSHIIAMQGPFSKELNLALIHFTGAKWLITKESGESGGFYEKAEAAAEGGIRLIVIERPQKEEGLGINETIDELKKLRESEDEHLSVPEPSAVTGPGNEGTQKYSDKIIRTDPDMADKTARITLVGLGMGGGSQLTLEAIDAIRQASVIFGAGRMIEDIRPYSHDKPLIPLYKKDEVNEFLNAHPEYDRACVVFSGDTGFYSGCADFGHGANIHILPGISSFSCLCARFGLREEEFTCASAHGRSADVTGLIASYGKVFLLLDGQNTVGAICRALTDSGYGDTFIYAGVRLGYADEETFCGRAEEFIHYEGDELAVIAMERGEGQYEG